MPNRLRFRSGQVHLVKVRVDADTVIEAGDLVFLDGDDVKSASDFSWTSDLATTQSAFAAQFLGVAQQPSADGETADISVDISPSSIYEFQVASGTYEVGDELGPDSGDDVLLNQQLEAVASGTLAIARAAEYKAAAATTLRVNFASAYYTGSANANASIG
ncbi:MAG: capsid cement protein [Planctomycetaceae bacterium]